MIITSKENELIKLCIKLQEKKYRKEYALFFVEGERIVKDSILNKQSLKYVFVEENSSSKNMSILDSCNAEIVVVSSEIAKYISTTVSNQGIFAIIEMPKFNLSNFGVRILILDSVQDPGNMGTLLRTAAATNFKDVLAINCVDMFNPKVLRSTMGGIFRINCISVGYEDVALLKNDNYLILSADMHGENIFKSNFKNKKVAVAVGNEGNGLSKEMRDLTTSFVSIPMQNGVESLNAGVSGSIIMYEISKGE